MNKLSFLFTLLKAPAILPLIPWVALAVCVAGVGFGINKLARERSYHHEIKEQKQNYVQCVKNAMSQAEIENCYLLQKQEAKLGKN